MLCEEKLMEMREKSSGEKNESITVIERETERMHRRIERGIKKTRTVTCNSLVH